MGTNDPIKILLNSRENNKTVCCKGRTYRIHCKFHTFFKFNIFYISKFQRGSYFKLLATADRNLKRDISLNL